MEPKVQKILTQLAKDQEKKVEKVELGLVANARTIVSSITEEEREFVKIAKEINSLKGKAENKVNILRNLLGNLKDAATRIKKAESELGEGEMGEYFLEFQRDVDKVIKSTISKYNF